jgi:hypothetical protein
MYDSETDRWTKRDSDTGRFMDQKSDGSRFKGVRRENLHPHNLSKNLKILFGVLLLLAAACVVWYIFR